MRKAVPKDQDNLELNYGYYPIVFESEALLIHIRELLQQNQIFTRRYFYPSLNKLSYVNYQECKVSESVSQRVLCLPLFFELGNSDIMEISKIINGGLER
jgi:dTDP-4-amino-4,6-dideoxygalactose transaminase